jgi:tetratricopeptide (TPR) repeat protein
MEALVIGTPEATADSAKQKVAEAIVKALPTGLTSNSDPVEARYSQDPDGKIQSTWTRAKQKPGDAAAWGDFADAVFNRAAAIRYSRGYPQITQKEQSLLKALYNVAAYAATKSVSLAPKSGTALARLAVVATFAGSDDASDALRQALKVDPTNVKCLEWGLQMFQPKWGGDTGNLIDLVNTIQSRADLFQKLSPLIVEALSATKDDYDSTKDRRSAEEQTMQDAQAKQEAAVKALLAKAQDAVGVFTKSNPQDPADLAILGEYYDWRNDRTAAHATYELWTSLMPASPAAHFAYAYFLHRAGDADNAIVQYRKTVDLDPTRPEALFRLSELLIAKAEYTEAVPLLQRLIKLQPTRVGAYWCLGEALNGDHKLAEARVAWQAAVDLDPGNVDHGKDAHQRLLDSGPVPNRPTGN